MKKPLICEASQGGVLFVEITALAGLWTKLWVSLAAYLSVGMDVAL